MNSPEEGEKTHAKTIAVTNRSYGRSNNQQKLPPVMTKNTVLNRPDGNNRISRGHPW